MTVAFALLVVLAPAPAAAQSGDDPEALGSPSARTVEGSGHQHAVSLHLLTLGTGGLAAQYERIPDDLRVSFVASAGYRAGAGDDFSSTTFAIGGGMRWWPWADIDDDDRRTGGFFLEGRVDVGWTRVTDEIENRVVGSSVDLAESVHVGWRFVLFDRVELSPTLGFGLSHQLDPEGLLAPSTEGKLGLALLLGVLL
jgi:hypothetical protein